MDSARQALAKCTTKLQPYIYGEFSEIEINKVDCKKSLEILRGLYEDVCSEEETKRSFSQRYTLDH